ncbi:transglutaminase domain-containing protein [bacterium]|nr:transglutaminase domain-containing protein [bacterium]
MKREVCRLLYLLVPMLLMSSCSRTDNVLYRLTGNAIHRVPGVYREQIRHALERAGENRETLETVLTSVAPEQVTGAAFLIAHMPEHDLRQLSSEFILDNIRCAYTAVDESRWTGTMPEEVFLNNVLPYASIHERRDNWRRDFHEWFFPLVRDCATPGEAAVLLNSRIWEMVNVHYSTKRPKADQSPCESMEAGLASCTGLAILLVDACRAAGIPARFAGIPLWVDESGNHSWVEVWHDGRWHCLGAGEPGPLDETWFMEKAGRTDPADPRHWIYAVSWEKTDLEYPVLWDTTVHYVSAVNVTDSYVQVQNDDDRVNVAFRLYERKGGPRVGAETVISSDGTVIGGGRTRNERHDLNDMLNFDLVPEKTYDLTCVVDGIEYRYVYITTRAKFQVEDIYLEDLK